MFDLNRFKQSLAETIVYCTPRFTMSDPKYSLRTLLYAFRNQDLGYDSLELLVDPVIGFRSRVVKWLLNNNACENPLPRGLSRGRLLGFDPENSLVEGASEMESRGFLDVSDAPACDTWVYGGRDNGAGQYLIAWIPQSLQQLIDQAIELNTTQCIQWLDNTSYGYSFLPILRAEGLI